MSLSGRLTIAMVSLVLLTAASIGTLSYLDVQSVVLPTQMDRLQAGTLQRIAGLRTYMAGARADVIALTHTPALKAISLSWQNGVDPRDNTPIETWKERLGELFAAQLSAKPEYLEVRLIGDDGDEIVHVDRVGPAGPARIVPLTELRENIGRPFRDTTPLEVGQTAFSLINLARDSDGKIAMPTKPVVRVWTPIADAQGKKFGVMALTLDMQPAFALLTQGMGAGAYAYVINEAGDFLLHPDPSRSFGWEFGKTYRLQEELPAVAPWLAARSDIVGRITGPGGEDLLAAMAFEPLGGRNLLGILLVLPRANALGWGDIIGRTSFVVAMAGVIIALGLAVLIARSLARPLTQMASSLSRFTGEEPVTMPVTAGGEIGVLARAFDRMARTVGENTAAMQREIEERTRAEKEARDMGARTRLFGAAVQSANDAVLTMTLDGVITGWNPAAERMFGYTAEEAIGRSVAIIATPEQQEEQRQNLERVRQGQQLANFETRRITKYGQPVDVAITISPVRSPSGEIVGISEIKRDLTARNAAEERFRIAVDASPGAMIMIDAKGTIVLVNEETKRMFGYPGNELIGAKVEKLVPARMRDAHLKNRQDFALDATRRVMGDGRDLFGVRKDGTEIAVEIGLNPISTSEGLMVIAAIVDITERKRNERLLAERANELERSNAELEQFAYVASHDLQEPLRMVASYAELLAERYHGKLDAKADKYIQYAVEGAKRMQRLVNDLLTYSRVGRTTGETAAVDMNALVRDVLKGLQRAVEDAKAKVEIGLLPVVFAQEGQLAQVLQNLIGNALKFRADREVTISIGAERSGNSWVFHVRDNGIGIESQYSERIFQMFQRLHDRETYEGSGIGLTIAKKIVERSGGRMWFESVPGEGTTFFFTLPAAKEKAA